MTREVVAPAMRTAKNHVSLKFFSKMLSERKHRCTDDSTVVSSVGRQVAGGCEQITTLRQISNIRIWRNS